jgi:hypothetical protein
MKSWLKYYKTKKQINDEKKRIANELKFLNDSLVGIKSWLKLLKSHERALNKSK